ncbi:hypothetical protein ANOM_002123 [Aspergillus nomiae NRRL 13137]|uniref:Xylanolytic transcriptional activator regulatory domain-containing protein n=1 Tax=Aspergillus nomiae NRRL (strain ATCC 15546 / NRRL 13137 / CBS 260.88 / M93) TaxID=1509407 RepID=A0A0L1JBW8_ASPN3|nr:uncharacterized protein ANOM_002123 [Aspergillus nomiae NRRL 13137]KNG89261.1 hypothetical protein ANOM_002123 [Aspergillus nomiae NRRL 13137]
MRIKQLEAVLSRPEMLKVEANIPRRTAAVEDFQSPESILSEFQRLPFQLSVEPGQSHADSTRPWDDHVMLCLPARHWSEVIVKFSLRELGWVHCALDSSVFIREHDAFWDSLIANEGNSLRNHAWIAVYLSVLAVGVYFISEGKIQNLQLVYESFSARDPSVRSSLGRGSIELSRSWRAAALKELNYANYTGKPSLRTVQALAILNVIHKNLGESDQEYILHGTAVNVARLIGLDRLEHDRGTASTHMDSLESNSSQQNVLRRLWWTLVVCDWIAVWSRPTTIHPESFTTVLEVQEGQSTFIDGTFTPDSPHSFNEGTSRPSVFEYHRAIAQLAIAIQNHAGSIRSWDIKVLQDTLGELDRVSLSFPPHLTLLGLEATMEVVGHEPNWTTVQRYLLHNCLDSWRIHLCVAILPHILETPNEEGRDVLQHGILAAKRLLQRRQHAPCLHFHKFWAVTASIITAGIYTIIDLICLRKYRSPPELSEQRELVRLSISLLEQSFTETRHGALLVLRRLSHLYDIIDPSQEINRLVLSKIVRLTASPRLWASLPDADATLGYLFPEPGFDNPGNTSPSSPSSSHGVDSRLSGDSTIQSEVPFEWDFTTGAGWSEILPHFGDLSSSLELIDMSMPWLDSVPLDDFMKES